MSKQKINNNEFFQQFIIKLCSSLDIKRALYQCSLFIGESIPFDELYLAITTKEACQLKHLIRVKADGKLLETHTVDIPAKTWEYMQNHFKTNDIKLMYAEENKGYADAISLIEKRVLTTLEIAIPLVFNNKPVGFLTLRVINEPSQEQLDLLSVIQKPLAHAVAASMHHEHEYKMQTGAFSVDVIFNRLKALKNITTDKELAQNLNTLPSVIANSRARSSIPYDKIILFCQQERILMDFIFMHSPFILSNKDENGLYKVIGPSGEKLINPTEVEDLLKLPHGSLDIYIKECALNSVIIPPIEKLPTEMMLTFHNALIYQQTYGENSPNIAKTIKIPLASGNVLENKQIETTDRFIHFCKEMTDSLPASVNVFAFRLKDDSMSPTLIKGDLVVVDPDKKIPKSNGIYAVLLANRIFIKRVMPTERDVMITTCDNKLYPSDTLHPDNIIGEVIWHARNL